MDPASPDLPPAAKATVVIVTKNRLADLRRALRSCLTQEPPCEVLVLDDASTDNTADMVAREFPTVRLVRHPASRGYIVRRNEAAHLVTTPYLVSIDDDAEFSAADVVRRTLADFDHPRIAVVSIAHADVLVGPDLKTPSLPGPGWWALPSYTGTAHALRHDVFLQLGGYRTALTHNTEERDFSTRLYNHGYFVRLGTAPQIFHYVSPVRDAWRGRMLERRNDICHAFWNVPMPHLIYHLPGTVLSGLWFGWRKGCLGATLAGYRRAPGVCLRTWRERKPIRGGIYRLLRRLNRCRLLPFAEIEGRLGSTTAVTG